MALAITAKIISAPDQLCDWITCWPSGAIMNCPNDPPALAMPKAVDWRSTGTKRPSAPRTTEKLIAARPKPISQPPPIFKSNGVSTPDMTNRPKE